VTTPTGDDRAHLDRLLDAMTAAGVDALLLGHEDGIRWVTGADRLRLTGTRPFAPACVVVRATRTAHLLATSDAGLPAFLDVDHVYGPSWDLVTLATRVAAVPGLARARTVGTDGTDPTVEDILAAFLPVATFVDAGPLLRGVRRRTSPADRAGIAAAIGVAQRGLATVVGTVAPGVTERRLSGAFAGRIGRLGATMPAFATATCVAGTAPRSFPGERTLAAGDLVTLRGGVVLDGWLGLVARTRAVGGATAGQVSAAEAALETLRLVTTACRPGRPVGSLRARPDVRAVDGLGTDLAPIGADDPLAVDDVCWIEVAVDGVLLGDVVHVGTDATVPLTGVPYGLG